MQALCGSIKLLFQNHNKAQTNRIQAEAQMWSQPQLTEGQAKRSGLLPWFHPSPDPLAGAFP